MGLLVHDSLYEETTKYRFSKHNYVTLIIIFIIITTLGIWVQVYAVIYIIYYIYIIRAYNYTYKIMCMFRNLSFLWYLGIWHLWWFKYPQLVSRLTNFCVLLLIRLVNIALPVFAYNNYRSCKYICKFNYYYNYK